MPHFPGALPALRTTPLWKKIKIHPRFLFVLCPRDALIVNDIEVKLSKSTASSREKDRAKEN